MGIVRRMRPALGTFVEVAVSDTDTTHGIDVAFSSLAQAEALWSFQDPASELSRLNASHGEWVPVHTATGRLLRLARALMLSSGGYFDFTVGGLLVQRGSLPDHGGAPCLARGTPHDLELMHGAARLRRPLRLTLDGIAKGYAIDLAAAAMRRAGARSGWINAGGDLLAFGDVQLPVVRRELDGTVLACGVLRNAAFASSRVNQGQDGFPADIIGSDFRTPSIGVWSVIARHAWRADALTKVAATASDAERTLLVAQLGGQLFVPSSGDM